MRYTASAMSLKLSRRTLLGAAFIQPRIARLAGTRVRIGLNSYSFNGPLRKGSIYESQTLVRNKFFGNKN